MVDEKWLRASGTRSRPLQGVRVVEFAGLGPGPHCAMLLSDLGADVLRVERPAPVRWKDPVTERGWAVLKVDVQTSEGRDVSRELIKQSDVLLEGFRPGVMERLELGPDTCLALQPRLIYGRMNGWGQAGPLSRAAGHDLNYISITGALAAMDSPASPPPVPLKLIGDFGGGSLFSRWAYMLRCWSANARDSDRSLMRPLWMAFRR